MDFPIFHLDWMGNRMLIAIIAITHVVINHPMAVGAYPLITLIERLGHKRRDPEWDRLAYRITFVVFIITTTVGALTGVGIWLSTSLVSPFGIGSLLRVFFWGWFAEWLVFISEVVLILAYYLTWKDCKTDALKRAHIRLGWTLSAFSWLTMALIVAVLGFMMSTGAWKENQSLLSAFFNPLYIPQLAFRTTFAMTTAGLFVWFLIFFFTKHNKELRHQAVRLVAGWTLVWLPLCLLAATWYYQAVPKSMTDNIGVGLLTMKFAEWQSAYVKIAALALGVIFLTAVIGFRKPAWVPRVILIIPFFMGVWLLGHFERAREFIRKPYVIANYMYSNGVRVDELPVLKRDGILTHSTYASIKTITPENELIAGREVFMLTCSRCHTSAGMNGVIQKLEHMYGKDPWDAEQLNGFIQNMHLSRTFMPPFPGSDKEREALVAFLMQLQKTREKLPGVQSVGIPRTESTKQ